MVLSATLHKKMMLPWTAYRDHAARASLVGSASPVPHSDPSLKSHRLHLAAVVAEIVCGACTSANDSTDFLFKMHSTCRLEFTLLSTIIPATGPGENSKDYLDID